MRIITNLFITAVIAIMLSVTGCSKSSPADSATPTPVIPVLTAITPAKALPNSAVSITGTNFTTDLTKISVTFNGVPATVYSATATEIVVGVPASAKTGNVVLISDGTTLTSPSFTVTSGTQTTYVTGYFEHVGIDGSGTVYGDGNGVIEKGTSTGVYSTFFNANSLGYKSVWGTAVDASGNVYIADKTTHTIVKITPAGVSSVLAGSGTAAYTDGTGIAASFLAGPYGLAIDAAGNLYTNDQYRVRKITPGGIVTTFAGGATAGYVDGATGTALLGGSEGIAVDAAGNVYVDDNKSVRKITPAGIVTTLAGNNTAGFTDGQGKVAQFYAPQAMAVDAAGNIFVADNQYGTPSNTTTTFVIRMVNKAGTVTSLIKNVYTTLASVPTTMVNGILGTASTNFPDGITIDAAGNMYICNTGAGVISKVTIN